MSRAIAVMLGAAVAWSTVAVGEVEAAGARYVVMPGRSKVEYVSGTQLGEFRGATDAVSGEVVLDPSAPDAARVSVTIGGQSLRSDNAARDQHMYDKVLEVTRFPSVTFTTREFRPATASPAAAGEGVLVGALTVHGVTRDVTVPVRYTVEAGVLQAAGKFTVNLADFEIAPPRLLGLKVRDTVVIDARLVARRAP